jgi:hypothetical protein
VIDRGGVVHNRQMNPQQQQITVSEPRMYFLRKKKYIYIYIKKTDISFHKKKKKKKTATTTTHPTANISSSARGTTVPSIVCVFPLRVWPYAMTQPIARACIARATTGCAQRSYTSASLTSAARHPSSAKFAASVPAETAACRPRWS